MKKLLLLAAVIVTGFSAMAQTKTDDLIKVNVEKYDFGKIKQNVPVTTFFVITNTSDKPVNIENAYAGCGCTTPEYSKEPVAPGGTTRLKVGYNAAAMGHFEKDVTIKLAGTQDQKIIKITGEVVDAAAFDAQAKNEVKKELKAEKKAAAPKTDAKTSKKEIKKSKTTASK